MRMEMSHVVVHVRDLAAMLDFYGELGFRVSDRGAVGPDGSIAAAFISTDRDTEHHQLAFVQAKANDDPPWRCPTLSRSHGDACASETVGDGLCVDPELVGDVGQRQSGGIQLGRLPEDVVVPSGQFVVARDTVAVEVAGHGRSVGVDEG